MSTLVRGDDAAIFAALRSLFRRVSESGDVVLVATISNACPVDPDG
jgi:hypothetical protein